MGDPARSTKSGATRLALRAYLCTDPKCTMMAMDLATWSAKAGRAVMILPAAWLHDAAQAPAGLRRVIREDRLAVEGAGVKGFPVMLGGDGDKFRVVSEAEWLEFASQ